MDIDCIVLAGGRGLRFGQDKALEPIGQRSLLEQVVFQLSSFEGETLIVTAQGKSYPQLYGYPKLRIVSDLYPNKGPLGGIYTGLKMSASFHNLVVACDMPFLNQALLRYMMEVAEGFDLVVPRVGKLIEPLHAIYSKNCLDPIESLFREDKMNVRGLFPLVRVRYVEAGEIDRFDPRHLSFFNINTAADLARAKKLAKEVVSCDQC